MGEDGLGDAASLIFIEIAGRTDSLSTLGLLTLLHRCDLLA